jgi:arabinogalactan endo-1,4-beta-galactosidase
MKNKTYFLIIFILLSLKMALAQQFWVGGTMEYGANLANKAGIVFKENGLAKDPYKSMKDHGANLIRLHVKLPPYSSSKTNNEVVDFQSPATVKTFFQKCKDNGLDVLLTFPYQSFTLEDNNSLNNYVAPLAWQAIAGNLTILKDSVYNYTYNTLDYFCQNGLIPAVVSVGNESTWHLMAPNVPESNLPAFDPARSVTLLNAGSKAVRDIATKYGVTIKVAWHMTSPVTTKWWLETTSSYNRDFDIMGLSCYYGWYNGDYAGYAGMKEYIAGMKSTYGKDFMVMETSQNYVDADYDSRSNILGNENIPLGYPVPATPETQRNYLTDLAQQVKEGGGVAVVYWGNDWVASDAVYTLSDGYGKGSSWDNKTYWDKNINLHSGIDWMKAFATDSAYVTFKVDVTDVDTTSGVWVTGDFPVNGNTWQFVRMSRERDNVFAATVLMKKGSSGVFYFMNKNAWGYRETVPSACVGTNGYDRNYNLGLNDARKEYKYIWGSCNTIPDQKYIPVTFQVDMTGVDVSKGVYIYGDVPDASGAKWKYITMTSSGNNIYQYTAQLLNGTYGAYRYANDPTGANMESVPTACQVWWNSYRGYNIPLLAQSYTYTTTWSGCNATPLTVPVTFKVDMTGIKTTAAYITGDFTNTGSGWTIKPMTKLSNNIYSYMANITVGSNGKFYFLKKNAWSARETVPTACASGTDRAYTIPSNSTGVIYAYKFGTCTTFESTQLSTITTIVDKYKSFLNLECYPNPIINDVLNIVTTSNGTASVELFNTLGQLVYSRKVAISQGEELKLDVSALQNGTYILSLKMPDKSIQEKRIVTKVNY